MKIFGGGGIDDILIVAKPTDYQGISHFANSVSEFPVSLHVIPVNEGGLLASWQLSDLGGLPTFRILRQPLSSWDHLVKRVFDVLVATVGVILLSPLFLIVSIAIKLDSSGPILFRQTRHGYNNEVIKVFKFRTFFFFPLKISTTLAD